MTCNYFEYKNMTDKLFYGVGLTDNHFNNVTEKIRQYIINESSYKKRFSWGRKNDSETLYLFER